MLGVTNLTPPSPKTQFEKADNKPALLGWGVAGLSVFFFSEWLIHLPGLNFVRRL